MIFPEDAENCTKCGEAMTKTGTEIVRRKRFLKKGAYASYYTSVCGHRLTVLRDLPRRRRR